MVFRPPLTSAQPGNCKQIAELESHLDWSLNQYPVILQEIKEYQDPAEILPIHALELGSLDIAGAYWHSEGSGKPSRNVQLDFMIPRQVFSLWALVSLPWAGSTAGDHVCSSWLGSKMFGTSTLLWSVLHGRKQDPLILKKDRQRVRRFWWWSWMQETGGNNGCPTKGSA